MATMSFTVVMYSTNTRSEKSRLLEWGGITGPASPYFPHKQHFSPSKASTKTVTHQDTLLNLTVQGTFLSIAFDTCLG